MRYRVQCMECGKKFLTAKLVPQCSRCNSVDTELAPHSAPKNKTADCHCSRGGNAQFCDHRS